MSNLKEETRYPCKKRQVNYNTLKNPINKATLIFF